MSIPILDTHQHLLYPSRWPYSWTDGLPTLMNKDFGYAEYCAAIEGTDIEASLFMESTPDDPHWREETAFIDQLSRQPESRIRGLIANCRPEEDGFEAYLDELNAYAVHGLRRFLHVAPEGTAESPCFIENIRRLSDRGLSFDLCVFENQLQMSQKIAAQCPDVQFVLDHCGVPEIADGNFKEWANSITELANVENVACKISGVLAYCPSDDATTETVRPYVEHCIESFGWDRVVWGSDWPVVTLTSSLRQWVATSREIVSGEDSDHQAKLFHRNAERIYNLSLNSQK